MSTIEVGDLLYEYTAKITGITEYGVSMASLQAGETAPPPEGARFDGAFNGTLTGPKLRGALKGVDYLRIRADGRFQLHIHAEITTDDGAQVALFSDGVAMPREGSTIADLRENVTLSTSSKAHAWLNALQVWATGTLDLPERIVQIKGYSA